MASHPVRLTPLELQVMDAAWRLGEATVRQIREALPEQRQAAYTTILTVVARLEEKGAVERVGKAGSAIVYRPAVERRAVHGRLVRELVERIGSPRRLVASLIEEGHLTLEDLRELESSLSETEPGEDE